MTSEEKHMTGGWSSQDVNSEEIKVKSKWVGNEGKEGGRMWWTGLS